MKKKILKILMTLGLIISMSTNAFAIEEMKDMENLNKNEMLHTIVDGPSILNDDYNNSNKATKSITNQELFKNYELFNTMGTNKRLWNKSYSNTYSVKKRIIATNYSFPWNNPGTAYVRITNTGNSVLTVNIYKGTRESNTITSGTVRPKQTRTFIVPKRFGSSDCRGNTCFAKQDFTVSVYNINNKISFRGIADIKY